MNQNKYITVDSLIESLKSDLPPNIRIDREQVIENIWKALKKIGIKQTDQYYAILHLEKNKVKLPSWLDEIERVLYIDKSDLLPTVSEMEDDIHYFINIGKPMSLTSSFIEDRNTYDYKYLIRNEYVHSNVDEGYIIVIYNSIPIDEYGEPLIENEIHLIEALTWYNVMKYLWYATVRNPGQYSALLSKAEQEWSYYAINAKTASIFPKNEDGRRDLQNNFMKLLPNLKI